MEQESLFGADRFDVVVGKLHQSRYWTDKDPVKDRALIEKLAAEYPQLDLAEEVVKWDAWMADHKSRKKVHCRARFTNWVCNAARFTRERRFGNRTTRPRNGGTRAGGAPARPESWAGSGYRSWEA